MDTLVLGAGLTGLSAAYRLRSDYLLIERASTPGGLARTDQISGFLFDRTGHWLHLRTALGRRLVSNLLGDNLVTINRSSKIFYQQHLIDYPFQSHLGDLDRKSTCECLWNAVSAHLEQEARPKPRNFEQFSRVLFGDGITDRFIIPYNQKLWGCKPTEISSEWCGRFFPKPNLETIVRGAFGLNDSQSGYNAKFVYPRTGGIQSLSDALASRVDHFLLNCAPSAIHFREQWIELSSVNGEPNPPSSTRRINYNTLVSTIPLPKLLQLGIDCPESVREATALLRCTELRYVNYGLRGTPMEGIHWLYIPERHLPFYRIGCSSNAVPSLAPPGKSSLYVEVGNDHDLNDEEVLCEIRKFFLETGIIRSENDIEVESLHHLPYGYVIFDQHYDRARSTIQSYLRHNHVLSIGRFGDWIYSSMEDALLDGWRTAKKIRNRRAGRAAI